MKRTWLNVIHDIIFFVISTIMFSNWWNDTCPRSIYSSIINVVIYNSPCDVLTNLIQSKVWKIWFQSVFLYLSKVMIFIYRWDSYNLRLFDHLWMGLFVPNIIMVKLTTLIQPFFDSGWGRNASTMYWSIIAKRLLHVLLSRYDYENDFL